MKTLHYFIIICFIFASCNKEYDKSSLREEMLEVNENCMNMPRPVDSYDYPILPGSKEWASFTTGEEMREACQVPVSVLEKMSTHAVIQAILEHPQLFLLFHRYEYQLDLRMVASSNAYSELAERKDAVAALSERLFLANPLTKGSERVSMTLELLISQYVFLSQMNLTEMKKIVEVSLKNDNLRQKHFKLPPLQYDRLIALLLIGKIMVAAEYADFLDAVNSNDELKDFLDLEIYCYLIHERNAGIPKIITNFGKKFLTLESNE